MTIGNERDLTAMRRAGKVVGLALAEMRRRVRPGMTTLELDAVGGAVLDRWGATSAPRSVYGFPGVNCISVNEEAVHGVPRDRTLRRGDLVKLDVTAELDGYIADAAITVPLEGASPEARALAECAEVAFWKAIRQARAGRPIAEIGRALEAEVTARGFHVLRELWSHGVGRTIHEDPSFPQYYDPRFQTALHAGLVITVEPIVAVGTGWSRTGADGWTISTQDGSLSAHYEHTLVVREGKPLILTAA